MMRIERRSLLAAFGATVAALGLRPRQADARAPVDGEAPVRWLLDETLDARDIASQGMVSPTLLGADLVQQWRQGLREELTAGRHGVRALVRWDKCFVLQGLVREEGMQARVERLSPALFRVTLSGRA